MGKACFLRNKAHSSPEDNRFEPHGGFSCMPNLMQASEFNFDALEFFTKHNFHLSHPDSIQTKVFQLKWIHNSKLTLSRLHGFIIADSLDLPDI